MFDPDYWNAHVEPALSRAVINYDFRETAQELAFCVAIGTLGNPGVDASGLTTTLFRFHHYTAGFMGSNDCNVLLAAAVAWVVRQQAKVPDELPHLPRLPFLRNILNGKVGATDMMMDLPHPGNEIPRLYNFQPSWLWWFEDNTEQLFVDHGNGEWMGYYAYKSQDGSGWECHHMRGIHFVDHEGLELQRDGIYREMKATSCVDDFGSFDLVGDYIDDTDHQVDLRKTNQGPGSTNWSIDASFTPLGIVGHCFEGDPDSPTRTGLVWLYKREWVRNEQAAERW